MNFEWRSHRDSNPDRSLRRRLLYPVELWKQSYQNIKKDRRNKHFSPFLIIPIFFFRVSKISNYSICLVAMSPICMLAANSGGETVISEPLS